MPEYSLRAAVSSDFGYFKETFDLTLRSYAVDVLRFDSEQIEGRIKDMFKIDSIQVIQSKNSDVGFLEVQDSSDGIVLSNIQIHPAYQNQGVGTRIIRDLIDRARLQSKRLSLRVFHVNPAKQLYFRLGFQVKEENDLGLILELRPT